MDIRTLSMYEYIYFYPLLADFPEPHPLSLLSLLFLNNNNGLGIIDLH